ncbi:HNH endonuclease [Streptomyces nitrosporeus]|uniref:HNH endonuclease n=1 Tax=Streptomyces nitrosporeus TaxID=28894 RepID=UPI003330DE11
MIAADKSYRDAARRTALHELETNNFKLSGVSSAEMIAVYANRMAKKKTPGRPIYDALMLAPQFGLCPLCGQRTVSTLDHHLPKTLYPSLAVNPINLIPACGDCNKLKLDIAPNSSDEETLHPYFDAVDDAVWLRAEVIEGDPIALRFFVDSPNSWDLTLTSRVRRHFRVFGLASLYASHSAPEVSSLGLSLESVFGDGGSEGEQRVRDNLLERAAGWRQVRLNTWQGATYTALAESPWFCRGGFLS